MYERRIGPSALSAPYVREEQIEFKEIDQNDPNSLNAPIQEVRREQTSIGNMPKKIWLARFQNETSNERYQNETSNIQLIERKQSKGNKGNIKREHPERSTHTVEKRFKCETCAKRFISSWNLRVHVRTHTGEKPFSCPECTRNFTGKGSLLNHMSIHTGKKPYSCSKCGMNFADSSNRLRHSRTHTNEKPYACSVCNKKFSQSNNMKLHMKIHDNNRLRFS
ncbi:zinc finger protein [Loa loa]|nr:zinc finger protein [Loa loa]EJD73442.1 zinc finger protein [Loa loa]